MDGKYTNMQYPYRLSKEIPALASTLPEFKKVKSDVRLEWHCSVYEVDKSILTTNLEWP
jgi:hypothetical protein